MGTKGNILKIIAVVTFLIMLVFNSISFIKPLGINSIADISNSYPNLIAPDSYTFAVWGIIYVLLLIFTIYQLGVFGKNRYKNEKEILHQARIAFIITNLLNAAWVVAWISDYMALSVILVIGMLITLQIFGKQLLKEYLADREKVLIRLPFSIYYGWITLVTVFNIAILLESIEFNIRGIPEITWMILLMVFITGIGAFRTLRNKDIAYGTVIIWGDIGIITVHTSAKGWNGAYPAAIAVTVAGMTIMLGCIGYLLIQKKKRK